MSFILDALKKSERERERQQRPAVVDIPYGRSNRKQPLWLLIVIGLLLLNCALLLVMWWRSGAQPPAAPVATNAPIVSSAGSSQSTARTITPPRPAEVRPLQEEASEPELTDDTAATLTDATPPEGPPLVRPATGLERAMAQQETLANNLKSDSLARSSFGSSSASIKSTTDLPTLESLGGNGALNLPAMRLDVHVYSSVAKERFAFINSHKYLEGQTLSEGPVLEKITQDGVILTYRGQRFLVPRQ